MFISRKLQCSFASGILVTDLSDHLPILVCLKDLRHEARLHKTVIYRKISTENIQKMNEELHTYNWNELLNDLNTEDSFNVGAFNAHMPEKTKRVNNKICKHEAWVTKSIMNSIAKQKQL